MLNSELEQKVWQVRRTILATKHRVRLEEIRILNVPPLLLLQ